VVPAATYATQLTELTTQITALITAINNAAARITSCTITIPPLVGE
jgi:hypothetical protein